ncbi:VOC family protein [Nonomuraea wenchangensis]|uniref:VOC family protein n=1 Tax=Nonomuraea wenchangensis TaxID=568860 RepID=UPI00379663DD
MHAGAPRDLPGHRADRRGCRGLRRPAGHGRVLEGGARRDARRHRPGGRPLKVLADLEGNEFCVLGPA